VTENAKPAIGADGGLRGLSSSSDAESHPIAPNPGHAQAKSRARLRLVPPPNPPRPRRIDVRIAATDGRGPIGRTRPLRLTESVVKNAVQKATRHERRLAARFLAAIR
jgi:hypothetical protein